MKVEPTWVLPGTVRALHLQQLQLFGGGSGVRDEGMLDSALNRPMNQFHYGEPTIFEMAAAYSFGIARNHPFVDGNKRTAFVVGALFLSLNGFELVATEVEATTTFLALAAGDLDESALSRWFEKNSQATP